MRKVTSVETTISGYSRGDIIYDLDRLNNALKGALESNSIKPADEEKYIAEWLDSHCHIFVDKINIIRDDREYELQGFELEGDK